MFEIQKATRQDYKSIAVSLRNKGIPYITPEQADRDIENGNLYTIKENGKPIAQCALVYEADHHYHAIKRLVVYNKKNCGRGIANAFICHFVYFNLPALGCTPWEDNIVMRNLLENYGFKFKYKFLEKYCCYVLTNCDCCDIINTSNERNNIL